MWLNSGCTCYSKSRYSSQSIWEGSNRSTCRHMFAHKVDGDHPQLLRPAPCSPKIRKAEQSQGSFFPKKTHNWRIKCNSFSDPSELVSLQESKGQLDLHCPVSYHGGQWSGRRLRYQARMRWGSWVFCRRSRSLQWPLWNRLTNQLHCLFWKHIGAVTEKNPKLFWMWQSQPPHKRLS